MHINKRPLMSVDEYMEMPMFIRMNDADDDERESNIDRERRQALTAIMSLRRMLMGTSMCGGAAATLMLEFTVFNPHPIVIVAAGIVGLYGYHLMGTGAEHYVAALRTYEDSQTQ